MREATWFQITAQPNFAMKLLPLRDKPAVCLQIGAFYGDASEWLLANVLTHEDSRLDDVDPWGHDESYHELDPIVEDWDYVFKSYISRMRAYDGKVDYFRNTSNSFFTWNAQHYHQSYDFIYIDGAHDCVSALEDGIHAYQCLKVGGLLAFDDYTYQTEDRDPYKAPALAIDAIRTLYHERLVTIDINSQVWMVKAK